tara:strand:+ start:115 stop:363 length:249 start_codon:yes stop_codon:yes gene_type:complete
MTKSISSNKKGFNKLPEAIQKKIDPALASEYKKGGSVKKKKGLYANINKRKKAGTSRSKKKSTISPKAYANMKKGFPKKKKK